MRIMQKLAAYFKQLADEFNDQANDHDQPSMFQPYRLDIIKQNGCLVAKLKSRADEKLKLILWQKGINQKDCATLYQHMKSTHPPKKIYFNLWTTKLESDDAKAIIEMSQTLGFFNQEFELELHGNTIGDLGAKYFADILPSLTQNFSLDLSDNHITAKGAEYLAVGIQQMQTGFNLDLDNNLFGNKGANFFADLLQNYSVPANFTLSLNNCNLTNDGIKNILHAIRQHRARPKVNVNLSHSCNLNLDLIEQLQTALTNNNIYQIRIECLAFLLALKDETHPIFYLAEEILAQIISYLRPYENEAQNKLFTDNVLTFFGRVNGSIDGNKRKFSPNDGANEQPNKKTRRVNCTLI